MMVEVKNRVLEEIGGQILKKKYMHFSTTKDFCLEDCPSHGWLNSV